MSEEAQKKLFIDFNKLDENFASNPNGVGLGLSICKNLIEGMGGSVFVKSQLNVGSDFIIHFRTSCSTVVPDKAKSPVKTKL